LTIPRRRRSGAVSVGSGGAKRGVHVPRYNLDDLAALFDLNPDNAVLLQPRRSSPGGVSPGRGLS
jgi:hypothetical protein